jgi:tetratricopeptide (TPR) repeat protein
MMLNIIFSKVSGNVLPSPEERAFIMGLNVAQTVAGDIAEMEQRGLLPDIPEDSGDMSRKDAKNAKESENFKDFGEAVNERNNVIAERSAEERGLILAARALTCYCEAVTRVSTLPADRYRELMQKAYLIFKNDFPENDISNTGMVYYYYLTARYLNLAGEAERILNDAIARSHSNSTLNRTALIQYLAEHFIVTGEYGRSAGVYEKELSGHFSDQRVAIYYALALYKSGNPKYREVCRKVLETLPSGYPGYYWSGFAHYLLGEVTYAQHDYERSNRFGPEYGQLV